MGALAKASFLGGRFPYNIKGVVLCGEMHVSTHAKLYNDFSYCK